MNIADAAVSATLILSIAAFLIFAVYVNTIGEPGPASFGLVEKVIQLDCMPNYEKVWVKPEGVGR